MGFVSLNSSVILKTQALISNVKLKFILTFPFILLSDVKLLIYAFIILLFIDTLLGTLYAIKTQTFRSSRFRESVFKFLLYFLLIITTRVLEHIIAPIIDTTMITQMVILIIAITEFSSILENLIALGVPLPKKQIMYTIVNLFQYKGGKEYIEYRESINNIKRDFSLLSTKYLKLIKRQRTKDVLKMKFSVWEDTVFSEILNVDFSRPNHEIATELNLIRKKALYDYSDLLSKNKINMKYAEEYDKSHRFKMTEVWQDIQEVIFSDKIKEPKDKQIKVCSIIVQALYNDLNHSLVEEN